MQYKTGNSGMRERKYFFALVFIIARSVILVGVSATVLAAKPECGNGICEGNESRTCPLDCGDEPPPPPQPGVESCGCSSGLPSSQAKAGRTYMREMVIPGNPITRYEVRLPENYAVDREGGTPVLLYLHGWGGSERSLPAPFARYAKKSGYLVVTPRGYGDGGRNSWNGFRSARLPNCLSREGYTLEDCEAGPNPALAGADSTCVDFDDSNFNYCYDSCQDQNGACPTWNGDAEYNTNTWDPGFSGDYTCYWTTCLDSVGQIDALLDEIERDYCVDRSMIWVTGCSNGGMFVYELAKDKRTSGRFAGYLPQVGSPHPGFTQRNSLNPNPPKFFMGFWGADDTTVPGQKYQTDVFGEAVALDTNFNGWLYMTARSVTAQWAEMNGLSGDPAYHDASSYASGLDCHAWRSGDEGAEAEIVECFFQGGHSCPGFGNMPQMMLDFAQRHPNGYITSEQCPK